MTRLEPEKSTKQLAVWKDLVEALEQVDVAWQAAQPTGASTASAPELPGNVAMALVRAGHRATEAIAGVTDVLVEQYDSDGGFHDIASALRQALHDWPAS